MNVCKIVLYDPYPFLENTFYDVNDKEMSRGIYNHF